MEFIGDLEWTSTAFGDGDLTSLVGWKIPVHVWVLGMQQYLRSSQGPEVWLVPLCL